MLYLEDYLEMIESLPQELRDRLTLMRELDLQIHNDRDKIKAKLNEFYRNAPNMSDDVREKEFDALRQEYHQKVLEIADEKVTLAKQLCELMDKYSRRLDHELLKFKIELEADNPGITEILEKRSIEADQQSSSNHTRGEKRRNLNASGKNHNSHNQEKNTTTPNGLATAVASAQVPTNKHNRNSQSTNNNSMAPASAPPTASFDGSGFALINAKLPNFANRVNLSLPGAMVAAAASQAIAVTQQAAPGRRTASMKASYEALNSDRFLSSIYINNLSANRLDDPDFHINQNNSRNSAANNNSLDEIIERSRKKLKRNRASTQYSSLNSNHQDESNHSSNATSTDTIHSTSNIHAGEPLYCHCHNISYGEMIFCENKQCPYQWFHIDCVNIKEVPEGSWFCTYCTEKSREQRN